MLRFPVFGLRDAPAAFRETLRRYLLRARESSAPVGPNFQVSTFQPCLSFVFRGSGGAVGALTSHPHDVLGCVEADILLRARKYFGSRRGGLKVGEQSFVHVGMEVSQATDAPVQMTQKNFTNAPQPIPTTPEMRASPRHPSSKKEVRICPCKLGGLCWSAAAPRADICARLAQLAARPHSPQGSEVYRSNDLENTVEKWQHATIFRNAPCSHYSEFTPGGAERRMRTGGEKVHTGAMLFAGWPDAAYGIKLKEDDVD